MLIGEYQHNIDAKGRVAVPSKFRDDLGALFYITKGLDNCLFVLPQDEWDRLVEKITYNSSTTAEAVHKDFNNIMSAIPPLFREEIRKSVFGKDFGDVPFNMLVKNLLPEFNEDVEKEEKPAKKTLPDYFPAIKDDKMEEEEEDSPPRLIFEEPEGDYISLLEVFPEPGELFPPSSTNTTTNSSNN